MFQYLSRTHALVGNFVNQQLLLVRIIAVVEGVITVGDCGAQLQQMGVVHIACHRFATEPLVYVHHLGLCPHRIAQQTYC